VDADRGFVAGLVEEGYDVLCAVLGGRVGMSMALELDCIGHVPRRRIV
jgi:hypothetical protein